jgi:sec-independent protein translocase protein TatB
MFNVGGGEILVILLLALIVLGPDRLPDAARKVGRYVNEFRRMTSGFQEEFRQAMDLSGTDSSEGQASSVDDAVHRATSGPRLLAAPEVPTVPSEPGTASADPTASVTEASSDESSAADSDGTEPVVRSETAAAAAPTPPDRAVSTADVAPAPGTGPELITPNRTEAPPKDESGSSSAA